MQNFFLSIVIICSIILCIFACIIVWFRNNKPGVKYATTYLCVLVFLYQVSTILAFYSPQYIFKVMLDIKIIAAFLIKTAFLYFIAVSIGDAVLSKIYLAIHLVTVSTVFLYFFCPPYKASIVTIVGPNMAQSGIGTQIYTVLSSLLYGVSAIVFLTAYKPFRRKRRYFVFLILLITLNTVLLSAFAFEAKDIVHEKAHILILLVLLAYFLKYTPFFETKDKLLSPVNIMEGIDETVVIFDKLGQPAYIHNGFQSVDLSGHLEEIDGLIKRNSHQPECTYNNGCIENETGSEGEITLKQKTVVQLHYKLSALYFNKEYMGKIIVLRDITSYTSLLEELNEKNRLLKEAFDKQKEYVKVARRLIGEEERAKILHMVNRTAGEFLKKVKIQVDSLEASALADGALVKERVKAENEELLALTIKAIGEVRQAVKKLHEIDRQEVQI